MKRFCYLLTFLLTGFTLVANETSNCNTYLAATETTGEFYTVNLEPETVCPEGYQASETQTFISRNPNFICSAKR